MVKYDRIEKYIVNALTHSIKHKNHVKTQDWVVISCFFLLSLYIIFVSIFCNSY